MIDFICQAQAQCYDNEISKTTTRKAAEASLASVAMLQRPREHNYMVTQLAMA